MIVQIVAFTSPMASATTSAFRIMLSPFFKTMDVGVRITLQDQGLQQLDAILHAPATRTTSVVEPIFGATLR